MKQSFNHNQNKPLISKPVGSAGLRLFWNAIYNSGSWGITILIALLATPYIVNKLSIEGFGIYALLTGILGNYEILDLGLGQGVTKFVAEYKAKEDYEGINRSISAALWVQVLLGITFALTLIFFAEFILRLLKVPSIFMEDARIGLYTVALGFIIAMCSGWLSSVLMGLQRYDITGKVSAFANLLMTAAVVVVLYMGFGLREVIYASILYHVVTLVAYLLYIKSELAEIKFSFHFDMRYFRKLLNFSGFMFVINVSALFNNSLIRFIIAAILSPAAVTYYVIPMKIIRAVGGGLNRIATVLFPFASELSTTMDMPRIRIVYLQASRIMVILAMPIYLVLTFFSREILFLWMGAEFAAQAWMVMSILAVAYLIAALTMVPANLSIGMGHSKMLATFSLFALGLGLIFVSILTNVLGIVGSASGQLIAALQGFALIVYVTIKIMKASLGNLLRTAYKYHLIAAVIIIPIFHLSRNYLRFDSILVFGVSILVFFSVYYAVFVWIDPTIYGELRRKILPHGEGRV